MCLYVHPSWLWWAVRTPWHHYDVAMNSQDASVWWSATLSLVVIVRWREAEAKKVFTDVDILSCDRQNHYQPAMAELRQALHAHPLTSWGGGVCVSQAKSDHQMQFPCATAIWDEDDITWKWAKWWRQHKEEEERTEQERKGDRVRWLNLLKGKVSLWRKGVNAQIYFNKNHVPHNTPFTRSKSHAFICWRQFQINYQKLELKNKNLSVQRCYIPIKTQNFSWHF